MPLLAVALRTKPSNEPMLAIYQADTGKRLRALTGHDGQINSAAFSGDGRFLVSTAEDQTVCLWDMLDLDKLIGQHGRLEGLTVSDGNPPKLFKVEPGNGLPEAVKEGGTLEKIWIPDGQGKEKEIALKTGRDNFTWRSGT